MSVEEIRNESRQKLIESSIERFNKDLGASPDAILDKLSLEMRPSKSLHLIWINDKGM